MTNRRNVWSASTTGGVRSLFTRRMFLGGSMVLGCLYIVRKLQPQLPKKKRCGQITHGAPDVPNVGSGGDLQTRPDESCLKLHRGRHARDGLKPMRCLASHRRWGVVTVRVLVRTDASIAGRVPSVPPGPDLGRFQRIAFVDSMWKIQRKNPTPAVGGCRRSRQVMLTPSQSNGGQLPPALSLPSLSATTFSLSPWLISERSTNSLPGVSEGLRKSSWDSRLIPLKQEPRSPPVSFG